MLPTKLFIIRTIYKSISASAENCINFVYIVYRIYCMFHFARFHSLKSFCFFMWVSSIFYDSFLLFFLLLLTTMLADVDALSFLFHSLFLFRYPFNIWISIHLIHINIICIHNLMVICVYIWFTCCKRHDRFLLFYF